MSDQSYEASVPSQLATSYLSDSDPSPIGEPITDLPAQTAHQGVTEEDILKTDTATSVFTLAHEHRRLIYDTIKAGTFPLFPNEQGHIDTSRPQNIVSGHGYKGPTVLILKAHQAACGFPTPEYVAETQLEEASRRAGLHGTTTNRPHPVTISITDQNDIGPDGKPAVKFIRLYNVAEAAHPEAVRHLARERALEREQSYNDWQERKSQEADVIGLPFEKKPYYQPRLRESNIAFRISQHDPEKYLGQVYTAMSLGTQNVTVDKYAALDAKENLIHYLYDKTVSKKTGKEVTNPMLVYALGNAASNHCKDNLATMFKKNERQHEQQQPGFGFEQQLHASEMSPGM